jgi:acyl-CoA reductase-like NAD-dependent aldehyde dehydrogenase
MSDQSPTSPDRRHPIAEGPADPEHDSTAAYGLDRAYVAALTRRVVSTSGETQAVSSPIGRTPLAHVPQSSPADVAEAFARARRAQAAWSATSVDQRAACLLRLHDLLLDRQDELIDLVVWESGKARKDAYLEVAHVALTARYYARTAHEHLDTRRVGGMFPVLTRAEVNRVPKGVVGIISPWNYPLTMALCDGLPALLAGNAVVIKPDAQTVLTALLAAQLLDEAGFPPELWQVVAGPGPEVGGAMIAAADYICFTGSTATGRLIARQCADRLIGCSLELGGKNPMLVLRDADVHRAAEGAVRGVFSNAGQLCVSMERLFVADQVYDRFVDAFVSRTEAMTLGASQDWGVDMGSLISQAQLDTVTAHVEDAVAKGARVVTGGRPRPDLAPYVYEPTILEGVSADMQCFGHETFGPVVALYRFHSEDEAVERANDGAYGLNSSVYTRDTARGRALARRITCGTVNVNEVYGATFGSLGAPMGGMRESGMGRRQGAEGIHRYTESQSVATQRLVPIAPMFGMSEETHAKVMTASLRLLNKLGRA